MAGVGEPGVVLLGHRLSPNWVALESAGARGQETIELNASVRITKAGRPLLK